MLLFEGCGDDVFVGIGDTDLYCDGRVCGVIGWGDDDLVGVVH